MRKDLITAVIAVVAFTLLLGVGYPLVVTGIAQVAAPDRADGSLVTKDGRTVGSRLLGQDFRVPARGPDGKPKTDADGEPVLVADRRYVQSRPSITTYAADATAFGNLGPNGVDTRDAHKANLDAYLALEWPYDRGLTARDVPPDAAQNSASGVDPHVSVANARIQAHRVAAVRRLPLSRVEALIDEHTDGRALGLFGEPGVNVLELNLALDRASANDTTGTRP